MLRYRFFNDFIANEWPNFRSKLFFLELDTDLVGGEIT